MTTPKSPEQIMEEFENLGELYALPKTLNGYSDVTGTNDENGMRYRAMSVSRDLQDYFRSSMASLLCYMAERMPKKFNVGENGESICDVYIPENEGFNRAVDACRILLTNETKKITNNE